MKYIALLLILLPLGGCSAPVKVPKTLPYYPCERIVNGTTQYVSCSDMEWVEQQLTKSRDEHHARQSSAR